MEDLGSLSGGTICCDDPATPRDEGLDWGWPFVNEEMLSIFEDNNVRATEVRVGPFRDPGEEEALAEVVRVLSSAYAKRIYVFVGLIDSWALANNENPWGDTCAVARGERLPNRYKEWISKVVVATRAYPNVVYFDGNEAFRCRPSVEWTQDIYETARAAGATQLIGSNSYVVDLDFGVIHGFRPPQANQVLLESDNQDHTPEAWIALARQSAGGIVFWKGPMSDAEWLRLLAMNKNEAYFHSFRRE